MQLRRIETLSLCLLTALCHAVSEQRDMCRVRRLCSVDSLESATLFYSPSLYVEYTPPQGTQYGLLDDRIEAGREFLVL